MKNKILLSLLITFATLYLPFQISAQQVFDVVSIGPGYTNQAFYSMENGEQANVSNTDWDLAFQITGFQATILVNGKNNVRLFKAGKSVNDWSAITAADTVGMLNPGNELLNQDTSWWSGAFNITADPSNGFDLGWGVYDFATHAVTGDSLFFMKMSTGEIKKIWIQSLMNNTYYFAYANIDGSAEVNTTLSKSAFTGKNFGYYSIANGASLDREPNKYTWDLSFAQYMSALPFPYKVSGVLANDSVAVAKAYPVDEATVTPWGLTPSYYINTIGYEWKAYDFNTNAWLIQDSTVFFVNDRIGFLWKVVFTGFGGSANGNFEFYKEKISATGVQENGGMPALLGVAPNPSTNNTQLTLFVKNYNATNNISVFDLNGKEVLRQPLPQQEGLITLPVSTENLANGTYMLRLLVDGVLNTEKLVIVK